MSKQQTAVEWLIEQCPRIKSIAANSLLEEALAMEKQQIIDAYYRIYSLVEMKMQNNTTTKPLKQNHE